MSLPQLLSALASAALTLISHGMIRLADRRSRSEYEAMLQALGRQSLDAVWFGGHPLVGWWGCGLVAFQFLRGLGIVGFMVTLVVLLLQA